MERDKIPTWSSLQKSDIRCAAKLGDIVHNSYPEDFAVFRRRVDLFPAGAFVLKTTAGEVAGYAISHPWILGSPPRLNQFLERLPHQPTCMHIHDIVVGTAFRQRGLASAIVRHMHTIALAMHIDTLSLIAVEGTEAIWQKSGFSVFETKEVTEACRSYSVSSVYMIRKKSLIK